MHTVISSVFLKIKYVLGFTQDLATLINENVMTISSGEGITFPALPCDELFYFISEAPLLPSAQKEL